MFPSAVTGGLVAPVAPEARQRLQPLIDAFDNDLGARIQLYAWMATMIGQEIPQFSVEAQQHYAKWQPGTMDFFIEPLPIDDGVHTVSKISALWGIPTEAEVQSSGMEHAMLGHTGNTRTLASFAMQFVTLGGGDADAWEPRDLEPLVAYIESLNAPDGPAQKDDSVARGEDVFWETGCIACHDGPRGSGVHLYEFDEIGTDDAMRYWMDPEGDGTTIPGVDLSLIHI